MTAGVNAATNAVACAGTVAKGAALGSFLPVIGNIVGGFLGGFLNPACHTAVNSAVEAGVNTAEAVEGFESSDGCSAPDSAPATASCASDQTPQGDAAVGRLQHGCARSTLWHPIHRRLSLALCRLLGCSILCHSTGLIIDGSHAVMRSLLRVTVSGVLHLVRLSLTAAATCVHGCAANIRCCCTRHNTLPASLTWEHA